MSNDYFQFKQFKILQRQAGMKVTTDGCLLGAWVADHCADTGSTHILDIGTGTGLLTLMLAQKLRHSSIHAVEVDKQAHDEAQHNFRHSPWQKRLSISHQPIQEHTSDFFYGIILCNPPFFKNSQQGKVASKNIAIHSTLLSMHDLLGSIMRLLAEDGTCYLLYPEAEMNRFVDLAKNAGLSLTKKVNILQKKGGAIFRIIGCFQKGIAKDLRKPETIILKTESGTYTAQAWSYLAPYYLERNNPKRQNFNGN